MDQPQEPTQPKNQALELLSKIEEATPTDNVKLSAYLSALKDEINKKDRQDAETNELLQKYEEAYQKLTAPANRVGVFIKDLQDGNVLVVQGEQEFVALVDPNVNLDDLKPGVRVKLNDAYAVVGTMPDSDAGNIVKVSQTLEDGRLRVGADAQNQQGRLVTLAEALKEAKIKSGDEVRLDPAGRVAVEHFLHQEAQDYFVEEVPETPWSKVGGQHKALDLIRETIEHPLLYPEIYKKFNKKPVKGILLYGPPGCGKTLIGKAVAYNLAKEYSERTGTETKECFLHISGPKILNMWLGETERMVREIFATAREKAKEGRLVVIFIDEAESVLRTRSQGRQLNISNTVVPQFCAEMDGMVELENVVIILTSNRPDYIDPAVLRPERIDRKVRVRRPDKDSTKEILEIYLSNKLPIDPNFAKENDGEACARKALLEGTLAYLWRETKATEFLQINTRSGDTNTLHWKDLVSGALLKSIVDRAKDYAIKRAIAEPKVNHGLNLEDMQMAVKDEYKENEIFPKNDAVADWLKLLDFEPDLVASVKPIGQNRGAEIIQKSVI